MTIQSSNFLRMNVSVLPDSATILSQYYFCVNGNDNAIGGSIYAVLFVIFEENVRTPHLAARESIKMGV